MKYLIGFAALFAFQACGKISPDEIKRQDPHPSALPRIQVSKAVIDGNWESDCVVEHAENRLYLKTTLSLQQGSLAKQVIIYKDPSCQTNVAWERVMSGHYELSSDVLVQEFYEIKITPRDYPSVVALNLEPYCHSKEPFSVNKQSIFNPVNQCNIPQEQKSKLDLRGTDRWGSELFLDNLKLHRLVAPPAQTPSL
ncbi:MAG: hypothetical protein JST80_12745 [Bdellovibrionales bacterium]|nr:hypothetical protein [Bdellovibrionales bacterium]